MKTSLLAAAAVAFVAFVGAPATAEAGGLHRMCPTNWMKHHHYHAKKAAAPKKAAKKSAKKVAAKKAAAKPLK